MALEGDAVTTDVTGDEPGLAGREAQRESDAVLSVGKLTEMGSEL
jgi:hypothetical protein